MTRTIAERYELDGEIGRGGMGVVYAATHVLTGRRVAVKLLDPHPDPTIRERLLKEARAAVRLRHKHVVDVLDVGSEADGTTYLILELLNGETLEALLKKKRVLGPEEALGLLVPIMNAVGAAHRIGFVHRDLKPANIFLHREDDGRMVPKLLDFGIAKELSNVIGSAPLTKTGVILGTPNYMAPEQVENAQIGPFTDVWSMGVVLYRCLSGQHAFAGENPVTVMVSISTGRFTPLHKAAPAIPFALAETIDKAISVEPDGRYADMDAFVDALLKSQRDAESGKRGVEAPEDAGIGPASVTPVVGMPAITEEMLAEADASSTVSSTASSKPSRAATSPVASRAAAAAAKKKKPRDRRADNMGWVMGLGALGAAAIFGYGVWSKDERPVTTVAAPSRLPPVRTASIAVTAPVVERTVKTSSAAPATASKAIVAEPVSPKERVEERPTTVVLAPASKTEPVSSGLSGARTDKRGAREAYERALASKSRGDPAKAIAELGEAIALAPDFVAAYNTRGLLHQEAKDLHAAIADFSAAIERDPKNASLYNNRALARQARAETFNAIDDLNRAIALDPRQSLFYLHRGRAYSASGNREKALADFNAALEREPSLTDAMWGRAVARQELGEHEKAIADLNVVLAREPRSDAYYRRGRSYAELGKTVQALDDFNEAIARDAKNANAYLRRGMLYVKQKKNEDAKRDLEKFLALDKGSGSNHAAVKRQLDRLNTTAP